MHTGYIIPRFPCRGQRKLSRALLLIGRRNDVPFGRRLLSSKAAESLPSTKPSRAAARSPIPTASTSPLAAKPDPEGTDDDKGPRPLVRPLGVAQPPVAGENSGIDPRSWRQRREDFLHHDKHLVRRKELTAQVAKPYFRDWTNMQYQQGKVFIAPTRVFRADKALYFPNLRGITAADSSRDYDTANILRGRVSVVSVFTGTWAQKQAESFVEDNAALQKMFRAAAASAEALRGSCSSESSSSGSESPLDASPEGGIYDPTLLQHVRLNVEPGRMRHAIVKFFLHRQQKHLTETEQAKYMVIHSGFEKRLRERLAMFNSQVGYVFLVDAACRVRWAGSAIAEAGEAASLNKGVLRLMRELQKAVEDARKLGKDKESEMGACLFDAFGDELAQMPMELGRLVGTMTQMVEP